MIGVLAASTRLTLHPHVVGLDTTVGIGRDEAVNTTSPDDSGPTAGRAMKERVVAGRIGIDDVAPVVSGGRYPAKAVVGEVVPVRATVWREGHDAVAATLVVRYHGKRYPQVGETRRL